MNESDVTSAVRREGADQYSREVLFNLESHLADVLGQVRRGIDSLRLETREQNVSAPQPANGNGHQVRI